MRMCWSSRHMERVEKIHESTKVFLTLWGLLVTGHSVTIPKGLQVYMIDRLSPIFIKVDVPSECLDFWCLCLGWSLCRFLWGLSTLFDSVVDNIQHDGHSILWSESPLVSLSEVEVICVRSLSQGHVEAQHGGQERYEELGFHFKLLTNNYKVI